MSRKKAALGFAIALVIVLPTAFFFTYGFTNMGYAQIRLSSRLIYEKIGWHTYIFGYTRTYDAFPPHSESGSIYVTREDIKNSFTEFPEKLGVPVDYFGISFTVTKINSGYGTEFGYDVITVKCTSPFG